MPAKRVILEMGTGNDLHGGDYTKAAVRAVADALHHSSLTADPHLRARRAQDAGRGHDRGSAAPTRSTPAVVKAALPHGEVTVKIVKGGLDVPDNETNDIAVIASAAIAVRMDLPQAGL